MLGFWKVLPLQQLDTWFLFFFFNLIIIFDVQTACSLCYKLVYSLPPRPRPRPPAHASPSPKRFLRGTETMFVCVKVRDPPHPFCVLMAVPSSWETPAAAAVKSLQLCPTLCDPIDGSPPGSPVPGILQARTLEWVAISFSNAWKWTQLCPTQQPHGLQPTRFSVYGIFQARVLAWGASGKPLVEPINSQHCPLSVRHDWMTSLSLSCIGEGNGNPLQCSCLENPRDGEAWLAAVCWLTSMGSNRVGHDWSDLAAAATAW